MVMFPYLPSPVLKDVFNDGDYLKMKALEINADFVKVTFFLKTFKLNVYLSYHVIPLWGKKEVITCIEMTEVEVAVLAALEKCTRLLVQNAERKQRFLSNQMAQDLCIARNAIVSVNPEDFE